MDMPANMSEPESHFQFNLLKARQKVIRYFTATVNPDDTAAASPAEEQRMIRRIRICVFCTCIIIQRHVVVVGHDDGAYASGSGSDGGGGGGGCGGGSGGGGGGCGGCVVYRRTFIVCAERRKEKNTFVQYRTTNVGVDDYDYDGSTAADGVQRW
ncbi:hypothetical protein V1478_003649 [Vespula squamosa]|uniref:Uncharacterized protein n=1 Tax=Vespula squamosa TaxID=30214 RepID=A0ABD2BMF2_VESSQ